MIKNLLFFIGEKKHMAKRKQTEESKLIIIARQRFGEENKDLLEEHLDNIAWEKRESEIHKKKYFRSRRMVRWTALGSGVSSAVLALGVFEATEGGFLLIIKILLILCSIVGPLTITFLDNSQNIEKNRETWIRHRVYVNNCINECLEFCNDTKKYNGKSENDAKKLLLDNLTEHRENNNRRFEENMNLTE